MMIDPMRPMAYGMVPLGTIGTKRPLRTRSGSGLTVKKLIEKQTAIVKIRRAKNNYIWEDELKRDCMILLASSFRSSG
jgi:hypothetical protein